MLQQLILVIIVTAVITVAPSPVTALLYTLTNFTCQGTGVKLSWTVEGHSLTDAIKEYREISVTINNNISVGVWSSVLTIKALPINDGVIIGCTVADQNLNFAFKGATLTVKG